MKSIIYALALLWSLNSIAKLRVITTTTNLASIVKEIGGEYLNVESLCKGTQDPHFLEAKPSYTFKLAKADLLISIGSGLEEGWLPLVIRGSRNPSLREGMKGHLVVSTDLPLLEKVQGELTRADGDVHPEGNPHFLLSPKMALLVAKKVLQRLILLDQKNESIYESNFNDLKRRLEEISNSKEKRKLKGLKVITFHKTLTYFYNEFEIENVDVLEPKPGVPPTASHILGIIAKIKKHNVQKIIVENYFDETVAKRIKKEVPSITIKIIPVAVGGKKQVDSIIKLYNYLQTAVGE